jgi:hypothetical protein
VGPAVKEKKESSKQHVRCWCCCSAWPARPHARARNLVNLACWCVPFFIFLLTVVLVLGLYLTQINYEIFAKN